MNNSNKAFEAHGKDFRNKAFEAHGKDFRAF
jgi:hypothetical protein